MSVIFSGMTYNISVSSTTFLFSTDDRIQKKTWAKAKKLWLPNKVNRIFYLFPLSVLLLLLQLLFITIIMAIFIIIIIIILDIIFSIWL